MSKNKDVKRYRCMNFGACAKADSGEIIEIDAIETLSGKPVCPHCKQDTLEELVESGNNKKTIMMAAGGVVVAAALGVGGYFLTKGDKKVEPPVVDHSVKISKIDAGENWTVMPTELSKVNNGDTIWIEPNEKVSKEEAAKGVTLNITPEDSTATVTPANVALTDTTVVTVSADNGKLSSKYVLVMKKKVEKETEEETEEGQDGHGQGPKGGSQNPPPGPYGTVNLGYGVYTGDLKNGKPHGHGTIKYKKSHKIVSSQEYIANPGDEFEGDFRNGIPSGGIGYWKHDGDITGMQL